MSSHFGKWGEPAFVGIIGDAGGGKSAQAFSTIIGSGYWLGLPGSSKPGMQLFGMTARSLAMHVDVRSLEDANEVLDKILDGTIPKRLFLALDDISILAQNSYLDAKDRYSKSRAFAMWDDLKRQMQNIRDKARRLGMNVIVTGHIGQPGTDGNGMFHRGGPDMPSKAMRKDLAHILDVLYVIEEDKSQWPWPRVFRCEPDPSWQMKDRHGIVAGRAPMNLGEVLRAAGFEVPRHPTLLWMENVAAKVCDRTLNSGDSREFIMKDTIERLKGRVHEGALYMAICDGLDRATLACRETLLDTLLASASETTSAPSAGIDILGG